MLGVVDQLELTGGTLEFNFASDDPGTDDEATGEASTGDDPEVTIEEALRQVLNTLGYVDAVLESTGEDSYRVSGLRVEPRAESG